jgi:hypothetical protein
MNRQTIIFGILIGTLTACEGIVGGDVNIYSVDTKKPLDSVRVVLYLNDTPVDTSLSDDMGYFRGSRFVGCVPSCPDATLIITKDGYETKTIDFKKYFEEQEFSSLARDSMKVFLTPL